MQSCSSSNTFLPPLSLSLFTVSLLGLFLTDSDAGEFVLVFSLSLYLNLGLLVKMNHMYVRFFFSD